MDVIYENVFNRNLDAEKAGLVAVQRQLRLRYEDELREEGEPENTEKRQRAMDRVRASHLHDEYQRLCGELEAEEDRRDQLLNQLALKVELKPHAAMYWVSRVSVYPERPSFMDSMKYLSPIKEMLEEHGFETHVRSTEKQYELWANCPPWMVDAIDRGAS